MSNQVNPQDVVQVVKGAGISFFGSVLGSGLRFLYLFFLARALSEAELGLYSLGLTILKFFVIVSLVGLDTGILRFIALYRGEKDFGRMKDTLKTSLMVSMPLSLLVSVAIFSFSEMLATDFFDKPDLKIVLQVFSFAIPFFTATMIFLAVMQSLRLVQYKVYTREVSENLFKYILTPLFLLLGWKLPGVIFANVISFLLVAVLAYYFVNKVLANYQVESQKRNEFKRLLLFSLPNSISEVTIRLTMWTDIFMLGYFSKSADIGIYYVVAGIAVLGVLFVDSFATVFNPIISDFFNRGETRQLEILYKMVSKWIFVTSCPFYLILIYYAKPLLNIYGEGFMLGAPALVILGLAYIFYSLTGLAGYVLLMTGKSWINMATNTFGCLLNIGLNYFLIPKYGILGAAMATGISIVCINTIRLSEVFCLVKVHPFNLGFSKPVLSSLISLSLVYATTSALEIQNTFLATAIGISLFLTSYGITLLMLGIDQEDRLVLDQLRMKFSRIHAS